MATVVETLLTAEEFGHRPDSGFPEELVRGKIIRMTVPKPYQGYICGNVTIAVGSFVKANDLGHVLGNDSGIITERGPDTVRGADVAYYSYNRVPKGSLDREEYLEVPPELVFEVLSPNDRWPKALAKTAEYLTAGVEVVLVLVLDPKRRVIHIFEPDRPVRILTEDDDLTIPTILTNFRVPTRQLFD
jgi:Uma2 family endonuclease